MQYENFNNDVHVCSGWKTVQDNDEMALGMKNT